MALSKPMPANMLSPILLTLVVGSALVRREAMQTILLWLSVVVLGMLRTAQETASLQAEYEYGITHVSFFDHIASQSTQVRDYIVAQISGNLNDTPSMSVVKAMTLGDKSGLSWDLRSVYTHAGASHVLAISGMHLAIIYSILSFFFSFIPRAIIFLPHYAYEKCCVRYFRKNRKSQFTIRLMNALRYICSITPSGKTIEIACSLFIMLSLWCYAFIVGLPPSIVRATVMLSLIILSRIIKRSIRLTASLAVAALIILLFNPLTLFDIGFQLSFLAVLGIGLYYNGINSIVHLNIGVLRWFWSAISISLSAQILVTPIVIYHFAQLPCYSVLTSIVVSVTTLMIVWCGVLLIPLSTIPMLPGKTIGATICSCLLSCSVRFQNSFLAWIDGLPYSYVSDIHISLAQTALAYVMIACVTILLRILTRARSKAPLD